MRRFFDFGRLPPSDQGPALVYAARRHLAALDDPTASPARIALNRRGLVRIATVARRLAVALPAAIAEQITSHHRSSTT